MKIAVLGPGGIGTTFAFQLARAGHEVTVIGRGKRLADLRREKAVVTSSGERAAVEVRDALEPTTPWDLVLVSVLAHQASAVLPALAASAAKTVMFMFNTFEPLARLREAVGASRFAFGFPAILATVDDGKLTTEIVTRGLVTTVTDPAWAKIFTDAGIPTVTHGDMESWLRTHAAMVVPFMIAAGRAYTRRAGVPWGEAMTLARAMDEGFRVVVGLGNTLTPEPMAKMSRLPVPALAALLWTATRVPSIRKSGVAGYAEPRALIDAMSAAAPGQVPTLLAVKP